MSITIDGARIDIQDFSISDMLRYAYQVKQFQISGPDWLGARRWDIAAKLPDGATRDQVPEMVRTLLAERFGMILHRSTTDQPVFALVVAKGGAKLKESPPDAAPTDGAGQVRAGAASDAKGVISTSTSNGTVKMATGADGMHIEVSRMDMAGLTDLLARFVTLPVVDATELKARYDLSLDVGLEDMLNLARSQGVNVQGARAAEATRAPAEASEPGASSVFAAIEQYGLKLEPRKSPIELLVIDHVEKNPTEN